MMWIWNLLNLVPNLVTEVTRYLNKKQDVDLEKYKIDGKIDQTLIAAEIELVKARASVFDNLNWIHYWMGAVTALYYTAIVFDALTERLLPSWHWDVMPLKGWADITANMIIGFFFLHAALDKYRR